MVARAAPYRFTSERRLRTSTLRSDPMAAIEVEIDDLLSMLDRTDVNAASLLWREAAVSTAALRSMFVRHRGRLVARDREEWVDPDFVYIERFAARYTAGAAMDPIILLDVAGTLMIPDGLHRVAGAIAAGVAEIAAYVAVLPR
jgi:hypothetical protein